VSALAVFAAANVLAAAAHSYGLLLIARVLAALAAAAFVPTASAAASSLAPAEYRGRTLATVVADITVAQVAGVPFGAFARGVTWLAIHVPNRRRPGRRSNPGSQRTRLAKTNQI